MLGLSDRGAIRGLFGLLLACDASGALAALRGQYELGVDPQAVLRTLLETVHGVTLAKLGTEATAGQSAEELRALQDWAAGLSFPALHRLWQLLLRGHDEVAKAALPIEAAEMALLRVIHASQLPDPAELARQITSGNVIAPAPAAPAKAAEPALPASMTELAAHLEASKRFQLAQQVRDYLRPVRFEGSEFEFGAARALPQDFVRELGAALRETTGVNWRLRCVEDAGAPTLREAQATNEAAEREAVLASPVVAAAMQAFPDAELIGWNKTGS
jgi:DNA polymerase-3 subunit gamma/tau